MLSTSRPESSSRVGLEKGESSRKILFPALFCSGRCLLHFDSLMRNATLSPLRLLPANKFECGIKCCCSNPPCYSYPQALCRQQGLGGRCGRRNYKISFLRGSIAGTSFTSFFSHQPCRSEYTFIDICCSSLVPFGLSLFAVKLLGLIQPHILYPSFFID